jgi:hypothetical protein
MTPSPIVLELREFLANGRAKLWKRQSWRTPIGPWLAEHSALLDETLVRITDAASATARAAHPEISDTDATFVLLASEAMGAPSCAPIPISISLSCPRKKRIPCSMPPSKKRFASSWKF